MNAWFFLNAPRNPSQASALNLFNALQAGQNVKGVVTNITDFGVFVDLGGVEGLIHISELSWGRVLHPNHIVKIGNTVDVQVLELAPSVVVLH